MLDRKRSARSHGLRATLWEDVDARVKPGMTADDGGRGRALSYALHRQPVLPRQLLQRHLRPRADMLDHLGRGERPEPAGRFIARVADEAEQEAGGEQVTGAGGVDELLDREGRH